MGELIKKLVTLGNALAIIIPRKIIKENELKRGDHVRIDKITKVEIQVNDVKQKTKQNKL